ncbi:MAG: asparagine synthase (glutamine-hydrolyzing) [Planctomycetes bacterium]|nr:asparagine synthase (glutamine-hydrolyzing) [Planctomycetota bacterium]
MCGIAGLFRFGEGPPPDEPTLRRMADTLFHRGPDGDGYSVRGPIGLAHRRLAIIDLSGGRQPMGNEDGSIEVTFNGEIYNFESLRERLLAKGHVFRTRSDTEVIVHLYEEEGDRVAEHLRGEFAFAIADHKRRRMLLARDRLGVKPLYYALDHRRLVFGSEAKAVLAEGSTPRRVDSSALLDYLAFRYVPSPRTIYPGMRKLPPAHTLVVESDGRATERRYWDLKFEPEPDVSVETWCERLRDAIAEAVKIQMVADVPVGGFLSGGVDSSTVISYMAEASAHPVVACSIGFSEGAYDERQYARTVAKHVGVDLREFLVEPQALDVVRKLAWHYDEPFGDSSSVPTYYVSKMAREHVTVALSGDGGDETFAGYRRYKFEAAEDRVRRMLPAGLRAVLCGALGRIYPKADWLPRPLRAKTTLLNLAERDPSRSWYRSVGSMAGFDRASLLRQETIDDAGGHDPADLISEAFRTAGTTDAVSRAQSCDYRTYLPEDILVKADRAAMACSLEVRVPLLDHVLLELAAKIPSDLKLHGGEGKWIFKKAMEPRLPHDILWRKKQGFAVPVREWLRADLREYAESLLFSKDARLSDWFEMRTVRSLWDEHQAGTRDASDLLWLLMSFEGFAQQHLVEHAAPRPTPEPVR